MIAIPQYTKAVTITTSDTVNFLDAGGQRLLCDAIYVGGAGTVPVVFQDDSTFTFTCVAGQILPVKAKRVNTGGSATLLAALYDI